MKSLPWEKIDIKVISLAVEQGKLERLDNVQIDQRDDLVDYLDTQGYELIYEQPHNRKLITYQLYFVQKSMLLSDKVRERIRTYQSPFTSKDI